MSRPDRPNIILIMTDQHRFDRLSCVSGGIPRTPNIDRIADDGTLFTNAYAASPVCSPSRAALKSGMYPPGCGVVGNWVPFKRDLQLMTHRLQANGYETAMVGKLHFVPHLGRFGFDWKRLHDAPYSVYAHDDKFSDYIHWLRTHSSKEYGADPVELFDEDENAFRSDDWYRFIMGSNFRVEEDHDIPWATGEAIRYLDERDPAKPCFLFVSYFGPHQPYDVPAPWNALYDPEEVELPPQFDAVMDNNPIFEARCSPRARQFRALWDRNAYRRMLASYLGQVSMIDHYVGTLFARLRQEGLWDESLVISVADHGDHNGAYGLFFKGDMYDSCCRIPLLVKPPGFAAKGSRRREVVNILDLYGTILDYAGDDSWRRPGIEARSLVPLLGGRADAWENQTWSIIGADPHRNLCMLRRDDMKLIRLAQGPTEALYELYDMTDEVVDVRNVFDDPRYRARRDGMVADLDAWWKEQVSKYPEAIVSHTRGASRSVGRG